ncbi:hypothetical protein JCM17960_26370 [Magnetospira thiophila]
MSPQRILMRTTCALSLLLFGGCQSLKSLALSGAVAGGAYLIDHAETEDWHNVPPEKKVAVIPVEMAHDVAFEANDATLMGAELGALDDFLARIRLQGTDEVSVQPATAHALSTRRAEAVAAYLGARRVNARLDDDYVRPGALDVVRVQVRRHLVSLPACPDWTGRPGNNLANGNSSNFGCATASNLGLMVADPRDLVAGRAIGPADGEYLAAGIDRYRKGETTPLDGSNSSADSSASDLTSALGGQ